MPVSVLGRTVRQAGWPLLAIRPAHLSVLEALVTHHRDPFDHLLISQAIAEGLAVMTADAEVARDPVECIAC